MLDICRSLDYASENILEPQLETSNFTLTFSNKEFSVVGILLLMAL